VEHRCSIFICVINTTDYMTLRSDLETLARAHFTTLTAAEVKICHAASNGELAFCGPSDDQNHPTNDPDKAGQWGTERHIKADLIRWLCVTAKEQVDPSGIQIFGARLIGALHLSHVTVPFPLAFACCQFSGEINLEGAHTRTVSFVKTFVGSIFADGAVIQGAVFLRDGSHCSGELRFTSAQIEGQFNCSRGILERAGGPSSDGSLAALILDGAVVNGAVLLRDGFRATSEVRMLRARIGADLDCEAGWFSGSKNPSDDYLSPALDVDGVTVGGSIYLRHGFRADGLVKLLGARIGLNLDCMGGEFNSAPREKLSGTRESLGADLAIIEGSALLSEGFLATGLVRFISSRIGGDLRCTNATFQSGLVVERARIDGTLYWRDIAVQATTQLDLMNTTAGSLSDDQASWPTAGYLQLHGFSYERISLSSPKAVQTRLGWLARMKQFSRQPYRQLAHVLRDEGDDTGARRVLFGMEHLRRQEENRGWLAYIRNTAFRVTIGYGFYPGRALLGLLILVVFGFSFYVGGYFAGSIAPTDKDAYGSFRKNNQLPPNYGSFHAFLYSLENSFPLVKLGQADRWQPDPDPQWQCKASRSPSRILCLITSPATMGVLRVVQICFGWFLATMGVAAVTGIVRKE
jgi:hypothetical protein